VTPRKATAKKTAAAAPAKKTAAKRAEQFVVFDRTRSITVGGVRDNREEAQIILDGLLEAGFSAEIRPA
jgi:hypothetical protein